MPFVIIGLIVLYIYLIYLFFKFLAVPVFVVGGIAYVIVILANYFRAVYAGIQGQLPASKTESPIPPEPAYKNYFFHKAYLDYRDIIVRASEYCWAHTKRIFKFNLSMFGVFWPFTWPLGVVFFGIYFVGAAAALVAFGIFSFVHLLIVGLVCICAYIIAFYFRIVEGIAMGWRRISFVCPHAGCYQHIALPIYVCPNCGALHKRLIPGPYGIFQRRCKCNGERLPTIPLLGRRKLDALCPNPNCMKPLASDIGSATNIHLPIVGGPASGKTNFLMASVLEIERDSLIHERDFELPERRDQRVYEANRKLFEDGYPVAKTAELSPESFRVRVREPNGADSVIFVYDAAGELYADSSDERRRQEYFAYVHGVFFVVDPFSLHGVKEEYADRLLSAGMRMSEEAPQDVYDRMVNTMRDLGKRGKGKFRMPFAVVVTKDDAFGLGDSIGEGSDKVRAWLMTNGEGNLVRKIESDFDKVQYYRCSALGHIPGGGAAVKPRGVIEPLEWLLEKRAVRIAGETARGVSWRSASFGYSVAFAVATLMFAAAGCGLQYGILKTPVGPHLAQFGRGFVSAGRATVRMIEGPEPIAAHGDTVYVLPPEGLIVRAKPSLHGRQMGVLKQGTGVPFLPKKRGWCLVRGSRGGYKVTGYLPISGLGKSRQTVIAAGQAGRSQRVTRTPSPNRIPQTSMSSVRDTSRAGRNAPITSTPASAPASSEPEASTTIARDTSSVSSPAPLVGRRVTARISNVDDEAILYVNGEIAIRSAWGKGEGGLSIGHQPGNSGWIDVTSFFHAGANELRLWVWNAPGCCGVSGTFEVSVDGAVVVSRAFKREDSQVGVKFNERMPLVLPQSKTAGQRAERDRIERRAPRATAQSDFDSGGLNGWSGYHTAIENPGSGGNGGGGCLVVTRDEAGPTGYFVAPEAYHGDWRGASELQMDLRSSGGTYFTSGHGMVGDVAIYNESKCAWRLFPSRPAANWERFVVSLSDDRGWHLQGGAAALDEVLMNVTDFRIRAEYGVGTDACGLDNVRVVWGD